MMRTKMSRTENALITVVEMLIAEDPGMIMMTTRMRMSHTEDGLDTAEGMVIATDALGGVMKTMMSPAKAALVMAVVVTEEEKVIAKIARTTMARDVVALLIAMMAIDSGIASHRNQADKSAELV